MLYSPVRVVHGVVGDEVSVLLLGTKPAGCVLKDPSLKLQTHLKGLIHADVSALMEEQLFDGPLPHQLQAHTEAQGDHPAPPPRVAALRGIVRTCLFVSLFVWLFV